jgi:hypothetical protein
VPDVVTEGLPVAGVSHRLVDASLGEADGERGDGDPVLVEDGEELIAEIGPERGVLLGKLKIHRFPLPR